MQNKSQYNHWPNHMREMDDFHFHDFIVSSFCDCEFRQPFLEEDNPFSGYASLKIFWINNEHTLGYAFSSEYLDSHMIIKKYIIGTEENWKNHRQKIAQEIV